MSPGHVLLVEPMRDGRWALLTDSAVRLSEHDTADAAVRAGRSTAGENDFLYVRDRYGRYRPVPHRTQAGRFNRQPSPT